MSIFDRLSRSLSPAWRERMHRLLRDTVAMFSAFRDPRVPWTAKVATFAGVLYLLMPVDLIPDIIPVLGQLDDIAIIPLAALVASKLVPPGVMDRLRHDADLRLVRWGPTVKRGILLFICFWVLMASIGGCMMLRSDRGKQGEQPGRLNWEQRLEQEYRELRGKQDDI